MHYDKDMSRDKKVKFTIASILNLSVFCIVIYCLISLISFFNNGNNRFIYFTNISNLFVGFISLTNTILLTLSVVRNKNCIPRAFSLIKVIALSMTTLTFFIVLFEIGPIDGYQKNYSGRNFFTHLVVPNLSLLSYLFFEEKLKIRWEYSFTVLIPLLVYSLTYVINVIIIKSWPDIYQINKQGLWYLYLLAFLVVDFGIGQGIYFLKRFIDLHESKH